ncbi:MAG: hypothetical protein ACL7BU_06420 [Candidatus Phlomobacter fragariae]
MSPIPKLKRKEENSIFIPAFWTVESIIKESIVREKITFILASKLDLCISEILALGYTNIQGKYLNVSKHVTRLGVIKDLKYDVQRLLSVPKSLLILL